MLTRGPGLIVEHGDAVLVGEGLPPHQFAVYAPEGAFDVEGDGDAGDDPAVIRRVQYRLNVDGIPNGQLRRRHHVQLRMGGAGGARPGEDRRSHSDREEQCPHYVLHQLPPPAGSGAAPDGSRPAAGISSVLSRSSATSQTAMMGKTFTNNVIKSAKRANPAATTDSSTQLGA